jgi:hypothetical protein
VVTVNEGTAELTAKAAEAWLAAKKFARLAAQSSTSGIVPRESNPNSKELLDRVFDVSAVKAGIAYPISYLGALDLWNLALLETGRIFLAAGSEKDGCTTEKPGVLRQMDFNVVEFAPELAQCIDAQIRVQSALVTTMKSFLANASARDRLEYFNVPPSWPDTQHGFARTIIGTMCLLAIDGVPEAWRLDRVVAIRAVASLVIESLAVEDLELLRGITAEAGARISDPRVKSELASLLPHSERREQTSAR